MEDNAGKTNDHIVPVMYLKRFGIPRSGGHQVEVAHMSDPGNGFRRNVKRIGSAEGFYWGVDPDGVPHHHVEKVLGYIESAATPAFRSLLDRGKTPFDNALPDPWPTRTAVRTAIAWWLAAQILRTSPQRDRLWRLPGDSLEEPSGLERANPHLDLIVEGIGPLARILAMRPWGVGFTNLCLFTSDVPVQIINARDDDDPLVAAAYWDIYLPLDPHRLLYLPGKVHMARRELMMDHLFSLPGWLAIGLNMLMVESAQRHLIWHPDHDPRPRLDMDEAMRVRASRTPTSGSDNIINYTAMPPGHGIERRWLDTHTWEVESGTTDASGDEGPRTDEGAIQMATALMERIQAARSEFESL